MGLFDFATDPDFNKEAEDSKGLQLKAATRGDLFRAAKEDSFLNNSLFNDEISNYLFTQQNRKYLEDLEGKPVDELINRMGTEIKSEFTATVTDKERKNQIFDDYVLSMRQKYPDKYAEVLTTSEIKELIQRERLAARQELNQVRAGAPEGLLSDITELGGVVVGQLGSPEQAAINIALAPLTSVRASLPILKRILIGGAKNAGVNAAFEATTQPFIAEELKEAKIAYDQKDYEAALVGSAVGGAGIYAVGTLAGETIKKVFRPNSRPKAFDNLAGEARRNGDGPYSEALAAMADAQRVQEMDLSAVSDMTAEQFDNLLRSVEQSIESGQGIPDAILRDAEPFFDRVDLNKIQNDDLKNIVRQYRASLADSTNLAVERAAGEAFSPEDLLELDNLRARAEVEGLTPEIRAEIDSIAARMTPENVTDPSIKRAKEKVSKSLSQEAKESVDARLREVFDEPSAKAIDELKARAKREGVTPEIKSKLDDAASKIDVDKIVDPKLKKNAQLLKNNAIVDKIYAGRADEADLKSYANETGERLVSVLDSESPEFKRSGLTYSEYLKSDKAKDALKQTYREASAKLKDNQTIIDEATGKEINAKNLEQREATGKSLAEAIRFCSTAR